MTMNQILHATPMTSDPETANGLVSVSAMPIDDARRLHDDLIAAGYVASWASDSDDRSRAWLYVMA